MVQVDVTTKMREIGKWIPGYHYLDEAVDINAGTEAVPIDVFHVKELEVMGAVSMFSADHASKVKVQVTADPTATLTAADDSKWVPLFYDDSEMEEVFDIAADGKLRFSFSDNAWRQLRIRCWPTTASDDAMITVYMSQRGS